MTRATPSGFSQAENAGSIPVARSSVGTIHAAKGIGMMKCRYAWPLVALLLLASCGSSSPPAAVIRATSTTLHAVTFSLRPVEGTSPPPCGSPLVAGKANARSCYRLAAPILGLGDVESARAIYDQNQQQWVVDVAVTDAAAPRFVKAMQQNVGRDVAIVIDSQVVVAVRVNEGIISKTMAISGNFDEQTAERIASGLTKPQPPDPRQKASVCRSGDLNTFRSPLQVPSYRRLTTAGTYWFGRVHLDPAPNDAHPTFSVAQASGGLPAGPFYSAAIYEVVLASWTSDADLVMESKGRAAKHEHVLAWVFIGKHVPVAAEDVSGGATTAPGVPCYFGTSIAAVNATTGEGIASAYDYSG